jgi:RNA polymerase sigma-19 factor, ECF subfamily
MFSLIFYNIVPVNNSFLKTISEEYSGLLDQELLAMVAQDNHQAFDEVYKRYWEVLVKTAYNVTQDKEVCHDCVQEIFVSLWAKRNQIKIRDLSRYLFRSVRLKVFEYLRNGNIAQKHLDRMNFIISSNNIEHITNHSELKMKLDLSLAKLPERCKEVFKLSRFEHLSNAEISNQLNISAKTVEGHITKALKQLRTDLGMLIIIFLDFSII